MEATIGGGGLDLPMRRRDGQDYAAAAAGGTTTGGGRWQELSGSQTRQGGGRYGSGGGRPLALGQVSGGGYSRDRAGRGSGRYQDSAYSGSGRTQGGSLRGPHGDVSSRMVSLKGVRA
ncbi:Eukaryotic translation initiation factor 3 subunit C [Stylosanthes scabra]|uniref:Eukaryotic translation initiation factor 3 subunit C n=1 Tax=Stylosanthes scabra TaxID=79078 RepID=A0ABU6XWG3_9FABA|nr:Eukaryotic translation initiation factor 3 subunit C [Stylosanthes scabra]